MMDTQLISAKHLAQYLTQSRQVINVLSFLFSSEKFEATPRMILETFGIIHASLLVASRCLGASETSPILKIKPKIRI